MRLQASRTIAIAVMAAAMAASAAAQAPPPSPEEFAKQAAQSDQFEILSGRVAEVQSPDPRIRALAETLIRDHSRTSAAVKEAARQSGLKPPPDGMDADQSRLLYSLQSVSGAEFDKLFLTQQAVAHQGALAVQQTYASSGSDPNLKRAAAAALPVIQQHLQMVRQMKGAGGG